MQKLRTNRLRTSLAVCVVATASLLCPASRADAPVASAEAADAGVAPSAAELRARFSGLYRYAGDAREQKQRLDAINRSVAGFFFAVRSMARAKISDRTRIMATCKLEFFGDGQIRSTVPGLPVAVSPETGAPASYRVEDDAIVLSQRFEGPSLVQVFTADEGGSRRNELTLSADGKALVMKATLSSPRLSAPVVYVLSYRRVE